MRDARTRECALRIGPGTGENPWVLCPMCNFEYVLLDRPHVDAAGNVIIPGECERGHRFEIGFEFHGGNTFAFCRVPKFTVIQGGRA